MPRHYSQLYRQLRSHDPADYHRTIRVYEERENEIGRLDVVEHFELTVAYVDALFETGEYRKHQLMVDLVIHASIRYDLRRVPWRGEEMYEWHLFRKAASAYRLLDYVTAEHVLRELIRMQPNNDTYPRFLRTVLFRRRTGLLQFGRAACIACLLLAAALITLNLLVVQNFYPAHAPALGQLSVGVFFVGLLTLLGSYAYGLFRAHRTARSFRTAQENK